MKAPGQDPGSAPLNLSAVDRASQLRQSRVRRGLNNVSTFEAIRVQRTQKNAGIMLELVI